MFAICTLTILLNLFQYSTSYNIIGGEKAVSKFLQRTMCQEDGQKDYTSLRLRAPRTYPASFVPITLDIEILGLRSITS